MEKQLSHIDSHGNAKMVNISEKAVTLRKAIASGKVILSPSTYKMLTDMKVPKGDVLATARIAGIMAAKKVGDLIPLCHPLPLEHIAIEFVLSEDLPGVEIIATASITSKTGVEMEALTAVSMAALTIYDMCKAVEKGIKITDIKLLEKSGGKSGTWKTKG